MVAPMGGLMPGHLCQGSASGLAPGLTTATASRGDHRSMHHTQRLRGRHYRERRETPYLG